MTSMFEVLDKDLVVIGTVTAFCSREALEVAQELYEEADSVREIEEDETNS